MSKLTSFCTALLCLFLTNVLHVEAQSLSRIEYFWDTDPGYNNATSVANLPVANGVPVNVSISTANVSPGLHTLGIRAKNSNNVWGQTYRQLVSVGTKLSRVEYFWDTDPGIGNATAYTNFTPGSMVELNIPLSTADARPGMRRLGIRVMDNGNQWSQTYYKNVFIGGNIEQVEYISSPFFFNIFTAFLIKSFCVFTDLSINSLVKYFDKFTSFIFKVPLPLHGASSKILSKEKKSSKFLAS